MTHRSLLLLQVLHLQVLLLLVGVGQAWVVLLVGVLVVVVVVFVVMEMLLARVEGQTVANPSRPLMQRAGHILPVVLWFQ